LVQTGGDLEASVVVDVAIVEHAAERQQASQMDSPFADTV
jgi:hypothetical protein